MADGPGEQDSLPWAVLLSRAAAARRVRGRRLVTACACARPSGRAPDVEVLSVGVLSFSAGAMYAASTRHGLLSLTAVLGSLAPAVTVVLAWRLVGERLDRSRWAGVSPPLVGVVLIAAG